MSEQAIRTLPVVSWNPVPFERKGIGNRRSFSSYPVALFRITGFAKQLNVPCRIGSALGKRDDVVVFDVFPATTFTASALVSAPDLMANVFGDTSASLCLPGLFLKTVNRLHGVGYCCIQLEPAGRKIKWSACSHRLKPAFSPTGRALPLKAQSMGAVLKHAKVTGQAPRALKVNACLCHPSAELKTR